MDLIEIARRTGVDPRRLRYAIYHTLVPGVNQVDVGRGSVRSFTGYEAFAVALAAMLLDAGLKRGLVAQCIHLLSGRYGRETPVRDVPLYRAFSDRAAAQLLLGDGRYVRLRTGAAAGRTSLDTGWLTGDGNIPIGYEPVVLVTVDVRPLAVALHKA